jgi:hypothetical protein
LQSSSKVTSVIELSAMPRVPAMPNHSHGPA